MAGDIATISQQLGAAVELTMNPSVPMEQRHQVRSELVFITYPDLSCYSRHLINWRNSRKTLRMGLSVASI